MKTRRADSRYRFLASLEQIETMLRDFATGKMPNILAESLISSGKLTPEQCIVMMSSGDPIGWSESYLVGMIENAEKSGGISFDHSAGLPGKLQYLGFRAVRNYLHAPDFIVHIWNKYIGTGSDPINDQVETDFAKHLGLTQGLEIKVIAEIPVKDGRFSLDWSFLKDCKGLIFDPVYRDITGNGLGGQMVYQVQTRENGHIDYLQTFSNGEFLIWMGLSDYSVEKTKDRSKWHVDGDILYGTSNKECVLLNFTFVENIGSSLSDNVPLLGKETQKIASETAAMLEKVLQAV